MPTVTIGGRVLETLPVAHPSAQGYLGWRKHKLLPWRKAALAVVGEEADIEAAFDGILLIVGHNEGVTREWVEANATATSLGECLRAAQGLGQDAPTGEAASP